jgi:hypothetical protein
VAIERQAGDDLFSTLRFRAAAIPIRAAPRGAEAAELLFKR